MPTSSSGRGVNSNSCASGWAGGSATFAARPPATTGSSNASPTFSLWRCGYASRITASAAPRSMRCTPLRWSASAKGKRGRRTSSAAKYRSAPPPPKPKGGMFVRHPKPLHANPFDGHTLGPVITELEQQTGVETRRIHVDKGYRGHNHKEKFRVWISGQVRRVTKPIRREMRRRAAVEPVIGHAKAEHRMGRNYLKGRDGDRINAVLAAAGYNFSLLLRWLARLLRALFQALAATSLSVRLV